MTDREPSSLADRLERHQAPILLGAVALGFALGVAWPGAHALETIVDSAIALMLLVTFLGVPFGALVEGLRHWRLLATLLVTSFVVAPVVAFALTRLVSHDAGLVAGALLVLLAPCVDYVVVFTALARGAHAGLLAATPVLMVVQVVLLPPLLGITAGQEVVAALDVGRLAAAFGLLVLLPLAIAAAIRLVGRRAPVVDRAASRAVGTVVPVTALVLVVVAASQARRILASADDLVALVPVYVGFAALMVAAGILVSRVARLGVADARAVVLSGVARNSLVVLPVALALPPALALAAPAVVAQTVVELVVLVVLVRLLPRLVCER
ncbi:bile acid:sodium symporter [Agrococcus sp. SGAir0287]|uniref:bile acid:sodium symporter n=1 Tax=Agrococcus sp. SGAir0287 TaxID=2070347 RepID=UPI0010CD4101|nr:bile acid:sodium symporter [Agrococcus sp. SGAir0287]QCR19564.1 arsenic resistance protein [Agrococcus sp. SGAir0287]